MLRCTGLWYLLLAGLALFSQQCRRRVMLLCLPAPLPSRHSQQAALINITSCRSERVRRRSGAEACSLFLAAGGVPKARQSGSLQAPARPERQGRAGRQGGHGLRQLVHEGARRQLVLASAAQRGARPLQVSEIQGLAGAWQAGSGQRRGACLGLQHAPAKRTDRPAEAGRLRLGPCWALTMVLHPLPLRAARCTPPAGPPTLLLQQRCVACTAKRSERCMQW